MKVRFACEDLLWNFFHKRDLSKIKKKTIGLVLA